MGHVTFDQLEDRRLLSAGAAGVWDDDAHAPAVRVPATVATRAVSATATARAAARVPQVAGSWAGTCKTGGAVTPISMQLPTQRGATAAGKFSLGPVTGNKTLTSTAVISANSDHAFYVIFEGKGYFASVNATLNGKQIVGRWAFNGGAGWKTGTLVLNLK